MKKFLKELFGEYFWIVGLTIFIVGATTLFNNPIGMLIFGGMCALIGVAIKTHNHMSKK